MNLLKKFKELQIRYGWHSLLSANELVWLIENGVIDAPIKAVQGSTIDVTLHPYIRKEMDSFDKKPRTVDMSKGESIRTIEETIEYNPYIMQPGEFLLGCTQERFKLPPWLSILFLMKSTPGRNGITHMMAGWGDATWEGRLTLEIMNCTRHHEHAIYNGMKLGQIVFLRHGSVPDWASYKNKGQYNGQDKVTPAGVLK